MANEKSNQDTQNDDNASEMDAVSTLPGLEISRSEVTILPVDNDTQQKTDNNRKTAIGGAIFLICYFIMGIIQLMAIYSYFRSHLELSPLISFPASACVAYFPIVGQILGYISAVKVWGWEWWQSGLLFFWWLVLPLLMGIIFGVFWVVFYLAATVFRIKDSR